ncbi:DUF445 domain-containing protein [Paenisporosarcina antarctica]|uniref:DUF445 family protein n=1 Tax=Paenisporosarcina antarctica TaxID=417367 RepID=A0A4P7A4H8_9BACL|nr:DUF445 family protein [Paenisporosarcina antarctica]QBP43036.1 DUF445 family protein [Paenisporosarcina antarctica]
MAFIGALIGGYTNHLAIKMLFRPHEAKYIGKWRVPFTPGLIPKRRDELAKQLGRTVVEHLLTPETFKRRFFSNDMRKKAELWIQSQLSKHVFESHMTLQQWLSKAGIEHVPSLVEGKFDSILDEQMALIESRFASKTVKEIAPEQWQKQAEERIPEIVTYMIEKGETYFDSEEGRQTVKRLIDDFLSSKGTFGNMIQMFMGESSTIVDRVQPEIQKFLRAPGTFEILSNVIRGEWEKLKSRPLNELIGGFDLQPVLTKVKSYAKQELAVEKRLDSTLQSYWPEGAYWTAINLTPKITEFAFIQGEVKLEEMIQRLRLEEMVQEQVDSFPVERLEDLVLGISRKEFKMITVLGAVLGALIGLIQGGIVYLMNMI